MARLKPSKGKQWPRIRERVNAGGTKSWLVDLRPFTKERKFFKDPAEAETFAEQKRVERKNHGVMSLAIPDELRREAYDLSETLRKIDPVLTLRMAVEFYVKHARPDGGVKTVQQVIDELAAKRTAAGRNANYLRVAGIMFGRFARTFGTRQIHTILSHDIEEWLDSHKAWTAITRLNYLRNLSVLWSYALKHHYVAANPLGKLERPTLADKPPGILSPDQVSKLLNRAVEDGDDDTKLFIAIGAFAGLRVAEVERLAWSEIDLRSKLIEVTAAKAKTRQRRLVDISANLGEWLKAVPPSHRTGKVIRGLVRIDRFAERAGVEDWPKNGLRHSFVSNHLAKYKNAAATAVQAGHDQDVLFRNYRELVRPAQATAFWKIFPQG